MSRRVLGSTDDIAWGPEITKRARRSTPASTDYTVGWISALHIEYVAAQAFLDEEHARPQYPPDQNDYTFGRIGEHNVVMTVLPAYGTVSAAIVARDMLHSFPNIRIRLMVGIGGGAPSSEHDIRLGDVVVSTPQDGYGGVFEYDFGKTIQEKAFQTTGFLNQPPMFLQAAVHGLRAHYDKDGHRLHDAVRGVLQRNPRLQAEYSRPDPTTDRLYQSTVIHTLDGETCAAVCGVRSEDLVPRTERTCVEENPTIHYGIIASANQVMKDASLRDRLTAEKKVLCFEMEAAGLMNHFPCLVIRGICDYSDSHKSSQWQGYAAMTAAAYATDLVSRLPTNPRVPIMQSRQDIKEDTAQQRLNFLEALRFEQTDTRQGNIKNAHSKTCSWLLKHPDYLSWVDPDEHNSFLWIKGKPGTGKSTLMKFAFNNARETMSKKILLSFFFNARGDLLGKSTTGLYRSLILQLLEHPAIRKCGWKPPAASEVNTYQCSVETLKLFFETTVQKFVKSSVVCFIDALDECNESQVRDMVSFFENICDLTASMGVEFRVCFSSRHYPHITITQGVYLVLEGQEGHGDDINRYLDSELRIGSSTFAQQVRIDLQKKASGVFMWVVLVVAILNKEYDSGRIHGLRRRLQEIPGDLHQLFHDILTRDSDRKEELLLCIQWVLFAYRPLMPKELYFAILAGIEAESLSKWDSDVVTPSDIQRFILNSSKGLIEVIGTTYPTVQFIHESVKDFLLKENGLREIWSTLGVHFRGESHDRLKQGCLIYINYVTSTTVLPRPSPLRQKDHTLRTSLEEGFPFLTYAVRGVLYHADQAEEGGVSQLKFLQTLQFRVWMKLSLILESSRRPVHTINASLLYMLALDNLANLIRIHPKRLLSFEVEDERYGPPIFAALATQSTKAVQAFLNALAEGDSSDPERMTNPELLQICERYVSDPNQQASFDNDFVFSPSKGVLGHLSQQGNEDLILSYLITRPLSVSLVPPQDKTLMVRAAEHGYEVVIKLLLDHGVDPDFARPLLSAVEHGRDTIVKLLLDNGANPDYNRIQYRKPLSLAAEKGHKRIVQLLLESGANREVTNMRGETPLSSAIQNGQDGIIGSLLDHGADPSARDGIGMIPLSHAVDRGDERLARLLLKHGANPHSRDDLGITPISLAARKGYAGLVKLLLEHGADPCARDNYGRTALLRAVEGGQEGIVKLLLEHGASTSTNDDMGTTPLSLAAERQYSRIMQQLQGVSDPPNISSQRPNPA